MKDRRAVQMLLVPTQQSISRRTKKADGTEEPGPGLYRLFLVLHDTVRILGVRDRATAHKMSAQPTDTPFHRQGGGEFVGGGDRDVRVVHDVSSIIRLMVLRSNIRFVHQVSHHKVTRNERKVQNTQRRTKSRRIASGPNTV